MAHRFFISPDNIRPPQVVVEGDPARQIQTVLRMQAGDVIIVLDNSGREWTVRLTTFHKKSVEGQIITERPAPGEPRVTLTLYQGTLKGQKFEWVLQKGTELGIACFVPTIFHRSVVKTGLTRKYDRWTNIIREAAEQSRRGKLPQLAPPLSFPQALAECPLTTLRLMPWEAAPRPGLKALLRQPPLETVALFIGPEGGITPAEAEQARAAGVQPVTLGPRILRAETAGLLASSLIFYEAGDIDSPPPLG